MSTPNPAAVAKAEARTQAQRERILSAALSCFERSGFHAASMAAIAEAAGMSAGLIYRYFDSKDAIILAIIEQQIGIVRRRIRELPASHDLVEGFLAHFDEAECSNGGRLSGALFLEMSAEATRNPAIAEALRRSDALIRAELAEWLGRSEEEGGAGLPADLAKERSLAFFFLITGLKVLKAREPGIDRTLLRRALETSAAAIVPTGPETGR